MRQQIDSLLSSFSSDNCILMHEKSNILHLLAPL